MRYRSHFALLGVVLICCAGCAVYQRQIKSNALEYLYPKGSEEVAPADVSLELPLRVGVAFAPATTPATEAFSATQKQALLERVAEAFRSHESIRHVEAIPAGYLTQGGGFDDLDRLVSAFGIDVIALVSYDQFQFSESGRSSWAYWTLIGAYVVRGEKNETRTLLDAVVYDIPSRAMLFHAPGESSLGGKSAPVEVGKKLRQASEEGFERAIDDLITNVSVELEAFAVRAATGTVRGAGTPAITIVDEKGNPVRSGGGGAGALDVFGLLAAALLGVSAWATRRETGPRG
ncbi:MAG: rhombotarget lipoprotein [Acidobacteriota bacterium]|nr:rhombotarget lipoprotein [Acidobacteriota bacterium]